MDIKPETADDSRGVGEPLMEPGQFGDGLMVRGNHRILAGKPEDVFGMKSLEENMLMRPQIFFWKGEIPYFGFLGSLAEQPHIVFILGEFHAESKPLIHPEAVPADVKIITLQKHFEEHREMASVLLRIEHLYQPRDKMGSPQNIQLGESYTKVIGTKIVGKFIFYFRSFNQWLYGA